MTTPYLTHESLETVAAHIAEHGETSVGELVAVIAMNGQTRLMDWMVLADLTAAGYTVRMVDVGRRRVPMVAK